MAALAVKQGAGLPHGSIRGHVQAGRCNRACGQKRARHARHARRAALGRMLKGADKEASTAVLRVRWSTSRCPEWGAVQGSFDGVAKRAGKAVPRAVHSHGGACTACAACRVFRPHAGRDRQGRPEWPAGHVPSGTRAPNGGCQSGRKERRDVGREVGASGGGKRGVVWAVHAAPMGGRRLGERGSRGAVCGVFVGTSFAETRP